jgi:signal transduction histidine kinase
LATKSKSISYWLLWKVVALLAFFALLLPLIKICIVSERHVVHGGNYQRVITTTEWRFNFGWNGNLVINIIVLLMFLLIAYLMVVTGQTRRRNPVRLYPIDRFYTDVYTLLVILANVTLHHPPLSNADNGYPFVYIFALIDLNYILSMARLAKSGNLFKNTLCAVLVRKRRTLLILQRDKKRFAVLITSSLLLYALVIASISIVFILYSLQYFTKWLGHSFQPIFLLILIALIAFALSLILKWLSSFIRLLNDMKEISSGNLNFRIESDGSYGTFAALERELKGVQAGIKNAVDEAMRSEIMKTELITNVTHDLKTPLTSIVNYVDLIKKVENNPPKTYEYATILEDKSHRLKLLIENLIEASKASSGNIEVNLEKLDLNELVRQTLGEYSERFEAAWLDVRTKFKDDIPTIKGDGKLLWRVMDNLLSNIVKYAQSGSRVYIETGEENGFGLITLKNISSQPLDIPVESLTDRFVRGDSSRTTEGSGLGLSIVYSLMELQKGKLSLTVDGDLFKSQIEIPVVEE